MDCSSNLLRTLHTKSHMPVVISNCNKSLEPSSLPSSGLFLDWHDLQNLVLQSRSDEHINYLVLLDWKREQIDLFKTLDLSILHKASKFGDRNPIFLLLSSTSASTTTSVSSSSSPTTSSSISKSSSKSPSISTSGWSTVRHSCPSGVLKRKA